MPSESIPLNKTHFILKKFLTNIQYQSEFYPIADTIEINTVRTKLQKDIENPPSIITHEQLINSFVNVFILLYLSDKFINNLGTWQLLARKSQLTAIKDFTSLYIEIFEKNLLFLLKKNEQNTCLVQLAENYCEYLLAVKKASIPWLVKLAGEKIGGVNFEDMQAAAHHKATEISELLKLAACKEKEDDEFFDAKEDDEFFDALEYLVEDDEFFDVENTEANATNQQSLLNDFFNWLKRALNSIKNIFNKPETNPTDSINRPAVTTTIQTPLLIQPDLLLSDKTTHAVSKENNGKKLKTSNSNFFKLNPENTSVTTVKWFAYLAGRI